MLADIHASFAAWRASRRIAARSKELLEALVLSEEEGPTVVCAEIRHQLAALTRAS